MYLDLHSYSCYHYFIFWFLRSSFEAIVDFDRPSFIGWKQRTLIRQQQQQQHIRTKCRVSEMSVIIIFFRQGPLFLEWGPRVMKNFFRNFPCKVFFLLILLFRQQKMSFSVSFPFLTEFGNNKWFSLSCFLWSVLLSTSTTLHCFSSFSSFLFLTYFLLLFFRPINKIWYYLFLHFSFFRETAKMINLILFYLSLSFSFTITVYLYFSLLSFSSLSF